MTRPRNDTVNMRRGFVNMCNGLVKAFNCSVKGFISLTKAFTGRYLLLLPILSLNKGPDSQ